MNDTDHVIPQMVHAPKGQTWTWNENVLVQWNWKELVAQLDDESMVFVVNGPLGLSGGLLGVGFLLRPKSYDHSRQEQLPKSAPKQPYWDFVVHRADGSGIRIHPRYSHTKFEAYEVDTHTIQVQPPRKGLGKSDGKGTYRKYLKMGVLRMLRFDANKRPRVANF